jgi:RNA polymerase sigma-70 factor (ECF subfamily)
VDWVTTTTILHDLRDYSNRGAWERFVDRFRRPIAHFVREMGVAAADCEDVAQNTLLAFAEAYRAGKYERGTGRLSAWLFGIAYYQALRQRRRAAHDPPPPVRPEGDDAPVEIAESVASDVWERVWDRYLLERCIERARSEFAADTFRAFELVVLEDRAPADAASILCVSVKSVYNAKHRVLTRVRQLAVDLGELEAPA